MKPAEFQREALALEDLEKELEIRRLTEDRQTNAEAAWRVGRTVKAYDRIGHWPHVHAPHDELVDPLYGAKFVALGVGTVFAKLVAEQYITDANLLVQTVTVAAFLGVSQAAESTFCAWKPIPSRFESGTRSVVATALIAAVPVLSWMLMRVPGNPVAALAETWEGVALVGSEVSLLLLGAAAGAAGRAYRWSRDFSRREVELRDRLIGLGVETMAVPAQPPASASLPVLG